MTKKLAPCLTNPISSKIFCFVIIIRVEFFSAKRLKYFLNFFSDLRNVSLAVNWNLQNASFAEHLGNVLSHLV